MSVIKSRYDELLRMLNTTDIDNAKLALAIIEENTTPNDLPWLISLFRHKGITNTIWREEAPETYAKLGGRAYNTYSSMLFGVVNSTIPTEIKIEGIEFIMNEMNKDLLKETLKDLEKEVSISKIETKIILNG